MSHNEWELLEIAEDIEQGDHITVDDDGEEKVFVYVKSNDKYVYLKCKKTKEIRRFNTDSLEEIDGTAVIIGKQNE